jgi:hypothetical protein
MTNNLLGSIEKEGKTRNSLGWNEEITPLFSVWRENDFLNIVRLFSFYILDLAKMQQ